MGVLLIYKNMSGTCASSDSQSANARRETGLVLLDVDEAALVTVIPVWILMITDDLIDN